MHVTKQVTKQVTQANPRISASPAAAFLGMSPAFPIK